MARWSTPTTGGGRVCRHGFSPLHQPGSPRRSRSTPASSSLSSTSFSSASVAQGVRALGPVMHFIHDEETDLVLVADAGPRPRAAAAAHHNRVGDFIQPIDLVNEQF